MKINGNAVRPGNIIEHQGRLWRATKIQHTQPGKGGAYLQVELKDIRDGTKLNERFRSSETIERVRLDQKQFQFLFTDGDDYTFMDNETYDQVTVHLDFIGEDAVRFLQEGERGDGILRRVADRRDLAGESAEITEADAGERSNASSSYKPAMLENGVKTLVPPHIEAGTRVVVNTVDAATLNVQS